MSVKDRGQRPTSEHEELCQLIPWYINGSLSNLEKRRVQEHLETCLACRAELNFHQQIAIAVREDDVDAEAVSYNFSRLRQRIASGDPGPVSDSGHLVRPSNVLAVVRDKISVRYPAIAAAAAITAAAVGLNLYWSGADQSIRYPTGDYQTLSSSGSDSVGVAGELLVVFQQATSEEAISKIFLEYGLEPVSRSEDQRLWRVRLANNSDVDSEFSAAVSRLRENGDILFVERTITGE